MDKNEIKRIISENLKKGLSLPEIQNLLAEQHGQKITFMELRLLASEIENVNWEKLSGETQDNKKSSDNEEAKDDTDEDVEYIDDEEDVEEIPEDKTAWSSGTVVEISKLARPGAVLSGSVKFASGASAEWVLDQFGRLMFEKANGKPTKNDLMEFQMELQKKLSGSM